MTQKFKLLSDIHIEFKPFELPVGENENETILILAGDIDSSVNNLKVFLTEMSKRFLKVIMVAGNHEYYSNTQSIYTIEKELQQINDEFSNVHYLQGGAVVRFGDLSIVGATLWTDLRKNSPQLINLLTSNDFSDFTYIKDVEQDIDRFGRDWGKKLIPFNPVAYYDLHQEHLSGLVESVGKEKADGQNIVVVTHHGCSNMSIHEKYINNPYNGCYASELFDMIYDELQPMVWCHGHVHHSVDYMINQTRVITNPCGYRQNPTDANKEFDPDFTFAIDINW